MNDDKPIGAPKLDDAQPIQPEQSNPTPLGQTPQGEPVEPGTIQKKKLNWKGFFFGIIAVVIIETLAVNMLKSGDPQIAKPNEPTITKSPSVTGMHSPTPSVAPKK